MTAPSDGESKSGNGTVADESPPAGQALVALSLIGRPGGRTMRDWPPRRWLVAGASTLGTVLLVGIPTALVPTGIFARGVPAPAWAWPVLLTTATLSGLLTATYVTASDAQVPRDSGRRGGMVGGFLTYLAVGCPTCNKVALLALGSSGAIRWFAPLQPALAGLGVLLLIYALRRRLAGERACPAASPATRG